MSKRVADKQLTHDNWEAEDESEEPGTFKRVAASALANRVIKKAKRTMSQLPESSSSPFAKFAGFSSSIQKSSTFGLTPKEETLESSKLSDAENVERKQNGSDSCNITAESQEKDDSTKVIGESAPNSGKKPESRDLDYYRQLRALNESVFRWIESHLSKNPLCDFSPVFDDYKKHLGNLEKKFPLKAKQQNTGKQSCSFPFKIPSSPSRSKPVNSSSENKSHSSSQPAAKMFKIDGSSLLAKGLSPASLEMLYGAGFASNTTNTSTFSFGIKDYATATVSGSPLGPASSSFAGKNNEETPDDDKKPTFSFSFAKKASGEEASSDSSKISDSSEKKPFSFAVMPSASVDPKEQDNNGVSEDEEYVPPKNEISEVSEEDSFYSKRCKLFYKKEDSYAEKGVGMLFLKPLNEKTQLVIRADTSLGNILLNIILDSSLPMQRMGKNNVLIVCVPNPPIIKGGSDSKEAIPLLIRVKTSEEADELLDMLNKHKS